MGSNAEAAPRQKYLVEEQNRALCALFGRPRTVLDVGCGIGLNGAAAKRTGARVTGIEIVPASIERARKVLDEVLVADIEREASLRDALGQRRFDLLLLADVLEHTTEPRAVLERLVPYLEDDGHVLISLPNVAAWPVRLGLLAGRFEYTRSGILDDTHLRFFTRESAVAMIEAAGLEVLRVEQNPMLVRGAKSLIERPCSSAATPSIRRRWDRPCRTRRTRPSSAPRRISSPTASPGSSPSRT